MQFKKSNTRKLKEMVTKARVQKFNQLILLYMQVESNDV
jgi:hypothetical protein